MHKNILDIFKSALMAVDPCHALKQKVRMLDGRIMADSRAYDLNNFDRVVVVGAGKGTAPMAQAIEEIFGDRISDGLIIVKYGHTGSLKRIRQIEASHPLPDNAGVTGTEELIDLLRGADKKTLVICLLSGGASSLLVSPSAGISLDDKKNTTGLLMRAGAAINELNAVRKHLSAIKGGRLAEMACPATLVTFILSDVIGDRLDVIASGPTVPDSSTFREAVDVIEKYGLGNKIPANVSGILKDGLDGKIDETPKGDEEFFHKTQTIIIGSITDAISAAKEKADAMGFDTKIITTELHGEAREVAEYLAGKAVEHRKSVRPGEKPGCLLSGGETTVTVRGNGTGGRNQELALAFALKIEGESGITLLSAGTDGTDGSTDAAGAVVDGETAIRARKSGLDPILYMANNDSYNFFKKLDSLSGEQCHLLTGPTGTNVMDIQIITIESINS